MAEAVFLGIEGGATRTTGVLMDAAGGVRAECAGGPTNLHTVGPDRAREAIAELLADLRRRAGEGAEAPAGSALCLAGLRGPADRAVWRGIVEGLGLAGPVLLMHDAAASLAAGSDDGTGILILCGTGSLIYGRTAEGDERFIGGRGPILGDEASGFDIGLRGLRAAARAADGRGPATCLERLIPDRLGLGGLEDLVAWASPFAKDRVAAVAPIVFEAARAGDDAAGRIVRDAAEELACCAGLVAEALWPAASIASGRVRVVLAGGVLRGQEPFREMVASHVARRAPGARSGVAAVSGAVGAARLARRAADAGRHAER